MPPFTARHLNLEAIGLQSIGQYGGIAHSDHVTAVDLLDFDGEALAGNSALKVEREHPIVPGSQDSCRDIGPGGQRPRLIQGRHRLVLPRPRLRLGSELGRQVVIVDDRVVVGLDGRQPEAGVVLAPRGSGTRVRPPRVEGLAGNGNHRVDQDEQVDSAPGADDGRGETTHRRGEDDDVGAVTDCVGDSIRGLRPAGRVVLGWQPDRDRLVPAGSQLGNEPMPLPWVAPSTGNQSVGRQSSLLPVLDGRHERVDGGWRTGRDHGLVHLRCVTQDDDAGRMPVGAQ